MNDLAKTVDVFLYSKQIMKKDVAEKIGLSKSNFHSLLNKSNFTIDDANKILGAVGYKVTFEIVPDTDWQV